MLDFDGERVRANAQKAETEDLLDRVTVYRDGVEPEAVEIIEDELHRRGVNGDAIHAHAVKRRGTLREENGTAARCSFCERPAVTVAWGWYRPRFFGTPLRLFPVFPRRFRYCEEHRVSDG